VRERFLSNGIEELTEILASQLKNAVLAQVHFTPWRVPLW
jgi:hypothetical protein